MNKLIIGAVALLIFIIFLTVLLTSFSAKPAPKTSGITPVPTISIRDSSSTRTFGEVIQDKNSGLTAKQRSDLENFKQKLPFSSDDFDVEYSNELDTFVVQLKNEDSGEKFEDFVRENGILDIYLGGSNNFLLSEDPISQTISSFREDLLNNLNHGQALLDADEDEEKQTLRKDEQLFVDTAKTLLDFKLNVGDETPDGKGSTTKGVIYPPNLGGPNRLGYYQMPNPTKDEYVFSSGTCPTQRFGQKELVGVLYTVAQAWKAKYPDSRLRIGDLNATGHKSHRWGIAVDITTSNRSAANTSGDRGKSIELGKMFVNTNLIKNILYCDNAVNNAVMGYARANRLSLQQMTCVSGHNDHFHVNINKPKGPESTPGC